MQFKPQNLVIEQEHIQSIGLTSVTIAFHSLIYQTRRILLGEGGQSPLRDFGGGADLMIFI